MCRIHKMQSVSQCLNLVNARVVGSIAMVGWNCCTLCMVWLCKKYILKSSDKLSSSHNNSSHGRPTCRCTVADMINTRLVIL